MTQPERTEAAILSVDIGTSSVRACLVSHQLKILHQSTRSLQLLSKTAGQAEMDLYSLVEKSLNCLQEASQWASIHRSQVSAVSFSSASASLVCLDQAFRPIRPVLTYADLRASSESQGLIDTYGKTAFLHTGAPMHASYWLPKFLWLKNQGLQLEGPLAFCTIKDFLIYHLTGQFIIDACNAGATGMMDINTMDWDDLSLGIAGIKAQQLPLIKPTTSLLYLKPQQAEALFPGENSPKIVLGAMDGVLASLGVGAFSPGQATTSLGSSGACRTAALEPITGQNAARMWSYPLTGDLWVSGGAMNNGGLVTQWLTRNFSRTRAITDDAYTEMLDAASKISPGSDGLLFLPYLFGERAPIYNELARGVYFGLHNRHHRGHFARAGLEGILFALYSIFEILQETQNKTLEIRAAGGYLQSPLMLQMQADIFGQPILVPGEQEGSVIGAAALALKALGYISGFDALQECFHIQAQYLPNGAAAPIYQDCYLRFTALFQHLAPVFKA